jgi:hypothetical protein
MRPADKYLEARVITGSELDEAGAVITMTARRWRQLRDQYCNMKGSIASVCGKTP